MAFLAALAIGAIVGAAAEKPIRGLARGGVKLAIRAGHGLKRMKDEIKEDLEDISEEVGTDEERREAAEALKGSGGDRGHEKRPPEPAHATRDGVAPRP